MKFLLDTNIIIPLEPSSLSDVEQQTGIALSFFRLALETGSGLFLHPASKIDIARDKDRSRREFRQLHFSKYPLLPDPPPLTEELIETLGDAEKDSNDWVDHHLIAAVLADSIDFLISEDRKLRRKARRLGIEDRVLLVIEAHNLINDLRRQEQQPPRPVEEVKAHRISLKDPILDSLREDYPNFDQWFSKCRKEHRQAWIIPGEGTNVAGFCIVNRELDPPGALKGNVLKICTFKVSPYHNGFRFGELLLKSVFEFSFENNYESIFVTTFKKQTRLIELFEDFGFMQIDSKTNLKEMILAKDLCPPRKWDYEALSYHIRFGPKHFLTDVPWFVIPIQPRYAEVLFPETPHQLGLFVGDHPSGNALKKAYLCHSQLKEIPAGSGLIFYRSGEHRGLIAAGIAENAFRTNSSIEIIRSVGRRTVYSQKEIVSMCRKQVLVILFRQAKAWFPETPRCDLIEGGIFTASPQSIISIKEEGIQWIKENL